MRNVRLTQYEFLRRFRENSGCEFPYQIIEFNGAVKPSSFHHAECGYTWSVPARGMYRKKPTGCPRCAGVEKFKSAQDWMDSYERLTGSKFPYSFVGEYRGAKVPTEFLHDACGYEWTAAPQNFRKGNGCPRCSGREEYKDFEEFSAKFKRKHYFACPYDAVEPIRGAVENIMFFHPLCGHTWSARPSNIMNGKGCPNCAAVKHSRSIRHKSFDDFKNALKKRNPDTDIDDYELMEDFKGVNNKTVVMHKVCGYEYEPLLNNLSSGQGCPRCTNSERYQSASDWTDTYKIKNPKSPIQITGVYINSTTKTEFTCEKGHEWGAMPTSIMGGGGCPHCAGSGFSSAKPGNLYYIKHFDDSANQHFYKIGITNRDVMERFKGTKVDAGQVKQWRFENGQEARDRENEILKKHSSDRISSYCLGKGNGHTEWFRRDVLGLF